MRDKTLQFQIVIVCFVGILAISLFLFGKTACQPEPEIEFIEVENYPDYYPNITLGVEKNSTGTYFEITLNDTLYAVIPLTELLNMKMKEKIEYFSRLELMVLLSNNELFVDNINELMDGWIPERFRLK